MKFKAFLQCTSCRFAALYFGPFFAGLVLARRDTPELACVGAVFWIAQSLGIEVTNRLSDRGEDEINRPERTALCALVGWQALKSIQIALWVGVLAIDVLWLRLTGNPSFALALGVSFCVGIGYSRGPRVSRSRYVGLMTVSLVFVGVFVMGWSTGDPLARPTSVWADQVISFLPLLIVVGLFIVTLAGVKDVTDRLGDLLAGYRSPFVDLLERRESTLLLGLAVCPFVLTLLFVLSGLLALRMAALIAFAPISMIVVAAVQRADTPTDRMLVREVFYNYWLVFSSAALVLFTPSVGMACAVLAASAYWMLATRWLHWGARLRIADVSQVARIAIPSDHNPSAARR
jgi:4-hydroxybenzoate polyprenyltransferase